MCCQSYHLSSRGTSLFLSIIACFSDADYLFVKVIRTRLRQPLVNNIPKYTGLLQTLKLVIAEEGARSLYGGLSAHLMRVVPNAAVMYSIYEGILRYGAAQDLLTGGV